jgi:hypothetical protein
MANVTISVTDSVLAFAKVYAAKRSLSLSSLLSKYLEQLMEWENGRKAAMEDYLSRKPYLDSGGRKYSRNEIYDRRVLR